MIALNKITSSSRSLTLAGVAAGFLPWLLADLTRAAKGRLVYIAPDDAAMSKVGEAAKFFAPEIDVIEFSAWDCLPYDRASPSLRTTSERLAALHDLQFGKKKSTLVLTTINAVTQRIITPFRIRALGTRLSPGKTIERDQLAQLLQANGYVRTDTVADAGEYALRGSLVDLFPSGANYALRLDFFGDEIESIRQFDPANQRTIGRIDHFDLLPASEALLDEENIKRFRSRYREKFGATATGDPLYQAISEGRRLAGMDHWLPLFEEKLSSFFDHLSEDDCIVRDSATIAAADSRFESISDYFGNRERTVSKEPGSYRPLAPQQLYLQKDEWEEQCATSHIHLLSNFDEPESDDIISFGVGNGKDFTPERAQNINIYKSVVEHLKKRELTGKKTVIASYSQGARERLEGLLKEHGYDRLGKAKSWQEALGIAATGVTALCILPLDTGFVAPDVDVMTEQDMLGDRLIRKKKKAKNADAFLAELSTLSTGDLVVHSEHGIGRYVGLISIPVGESPHDCVALEYSGGDKLYVPVENIDVLSRYGSDNENAVLDKLGGEAWQRRRSKMKERIREIAGELMKVAAARAVRPAEVLRAEDTAYASFVDRFPYEATDDQDRVITEVINDLAAGKPMDRLVCGDVGFGKTEVAMRAAFVAAMAGMQVAIIAPTTLLARQHYTNFVERFQGFPLNIGRLSRLVPAAESKATKEGLAAGTVDIVVGTHALLAKTLEFKNVGLVIVDEEQRFGVTHKERLKSLKADVHVLTLTATPIPRTLQMAMSGLRELSVIQTPPVDRLAVRTYVMPWDPVILREALLREHYRGGQSFFVTPRIADLTDVEEFIRENIPEIKYITAHGQMAPGQVEERMSAFYDKRYDVLLSTTIVESGLDIPSANTLIIHRADRFGLAQLYQLRGRVGRSKIRAYAYLTTAPNRVISETAEKRLKVLNDLDSLGAGFQLASHDLDIRGAGNLVGDEQSGHIKEVGFELYQSMLEDAIMAAKAGVNGLEMPQEKFSPQITVDAPILIPEDYVPDLPLRMGLYRRMNDLPDRPSIEAFAAEMIDRFGPIPDPTENLLKLIEIKLNCINAFVSKIEIGPRGALVTFHNDHFPNIAGLLAYVERLNGVAKLRPDNKLVINRAWRDPKSRLHGVLQLSKGLSNILKVKSKK